MSNNKNNIAYETEVSRLVALGRFDDAVNLCATWYKDCGQSATTFPVYHTANAIGAARLGDAESANKIFSKAVTLGGKP